MSHLTAKKHLPSWKFNLTFLVIMSLTTGLVVDILIHQVGGSQRIINTWQSVVIASIFTVVFYSSFVLSGHFLRKQFSLGSVRNLWIYIGFSSVVMLSAFFLAAWINEWIFPALDLVSRESSAFYVVFGISVLACVVGNAIYYGRDFYHQFMEAERLRHESELAALKAQINPHFLFNSLNSIASLIRTDPEKAEMVIEDLSDLFRYSLKSSQKSEVTLHEELEMAKMYLAVEKARFGERLHYTFDVEGVVNQVSLPGLVLLPLVENCIKHGSTGTMDPFHIYVKISKSEQFLELEVIDNGPGFAGKKPEELMKNGTGLRNVKERLELNYGTKATLIPEGNSVTLHIPVN